MPERPAPTLQFTITHQPLNHQLNPPGLSISPPIRQVRKIALRAIQVCGCAVEWVGAITPAEFAVPQLFNHRDYSGGQIQTFSFFLASLFLSAPATNPPLPIVSPRPLTALDRENFDKLSDEACGRIQGRHHLILRLTSQNADRNKEDSKNGPPE